ncbi:MAG: hypothetical protein AAF849_07285 [Bacteroidota bacterium]
MNTPGPPKLSTADRLMPIDDIYLDAFASQPSWQKIYLRYPSEKAEVGYTTARVLFEDNSCWQLELASDAMSYTNK